MSFILCEGRWYLRTLNIIMLQCKRCVLNFLIVMIGLINCFVQSQNDIRKYNCEDFSQLVIIATLDGSLTAIEVKSGVQCWKTIINKDTFMSSSLSNFKVYENGKRVWIVPSLDGSLFSYDGNSITPLVMNVDSLLTASATIDSKASIVGGKLKNFYGINRRTGKIYSKCNLYGCRYASPVQSDDVLNIEEVTQTVNAFDFVRKKLSWHFGVGELALKAGNFGKISSDDLNRPPTNKYLLGNDHEPSSLIKNIKISLHSGFVAMADKRMELSWMYQTHCPILDVWFVSGKNVYLLDPFDKNTEFFPQWGFDAVSSSRLFLGTYKGECFVKKSRKPVLRTHFSTALSTELLLRADMSGMRETYMPYWNMTNSSMCFLIPDTVPAISTESVPKVITSDNFTHEYGSYFYTNQTIIENATHCIVNNYLLEDKPDFNSYAWLLGCFSALLTMACIIFSLYFKQETSKVEAPAIELKIIQNGTTLSKTSDENNELKDKNYISRFHEDFELLSILGKGGFGVVMEVKNKIDNCHYAVKRIRVPDLLKNKDQQEKVMREVRALAMLEHPGIVRYYNSWIENPPAGWQKNKDAELNLCDVSSDKLTQKTSSVSVKKKNHSKKLKFDSLIHFQNSSTSEEVRLERKKRSSDFSSGGVDFRDSAPSLTHDDDMYDKVVSLNFSKHNEFSSGESLSSGSKTSSEDVEQTVIENIDASYLFIQMQLCKKENLSNWLKINFVREYNTVMIYFTQLVDAMEYVHKCGIMHRDLKPSNIYFSMDGTIKIGDFGLATSSTTPQNGRVAVCSKRSSCHTRGCGTRLYMSPEQRNNKHYNSKTDIFSLGLIFFELLQPFYTFSERSRVMMDVRKSKFPNEFTDKYPTESELVKAMLATDPNERPTVLEVKKHPLCWTYSMHEID